MYEHWYCWLLMYNVHLAALAWYLHCKSALKTACALFNWSIWGPNWQLRFYVLSYGLSSPLMSESIPSSAAQIVPCIPCLHFQSSDSSVSSSFSLVLIPICSALLHCVNFFHSSCLLLQLLLPFTLVLFGQLTWFDIWWQERSVRLSSTHVLVR